MGLALRIWFRKMSARLRTLFFKKLLRCFGRSSRYGPPDKRRQRGPAVISFDPPHHTNDLLISVIEKNEKGNFVSNIKKEMISTAHPCPLWFFHPYANIHPQDGCDRLGATQRPFLHCDPMALDVPWGSCLEERNGHVNNRSFSSCSELRTQGLPLLSSIDQSMMDPSSPGLIHPQ